MISSTGSDNPYTTSVVQPPASALSAAPPTSRRRIAAWAMWDWGTQPFNTVITTFVFSVYLTSAAFGDKDFTSKALGISTAISGVLVALLAPVLGQNSDRTGKTVRNLRLQTWLLAGLSASLFFIEAKPAFLYLGLILLGVGSIISEIAGVNYNATIEQVASPANVGKVSGFGWGMGYLGGIIVLLLIFFAFISPEVGLFGVTGANGLDIRVSMVVCGVWTLLFTIPTFRLLRDRPGRSSERVGVVASYRMLFGTIRGLWRTSRPTALFLLASALFRDGLAGVFAFGAVIAAGTFGFTPGQVIIFGAAANVVAGVSTMLFGLLDDVIGPRVVILLSLAGLSVAGVVVFVLHDGGQSVFWACGLTMSALVGPAQSASRSFLARLIPEGKSGEVFGLYATTGRVVSFLAPAAFTASIALGDKITQAQDAQYFGILGIVLVLVLGFIAMLFVGSTGHGIGAEADASAID